MATKKASTKNPGGRPAYGANPDERKVQAVILRLRAKGFSYATIANELNARGSRNRSGSDWTAQNVWHVHRSAKLAEQEGAA